MYYKEKNKYNETRQEQQTKQKNKLIRDKSPFFWH